MQLSILMVTPVSLNASDTAIDRCSVQSNKDRGPNQSLLASKDWQTSSIPRIDDSSPNFWWCVCVCVEGAVGGGVSELTHWHGSCQQWLRPFEVTVLWLSGISLFFSSNQAYTNSDPLNLKVWLTLTQGDCEVEGNNTNSNILITTILLLY